MIVDESKCIGCELCVEICPINAFIVKNNKAVVNPDNCLECCACEFGCPVEAIKVVNSENN